MLVHDQLHRDYEVLKLAPHLKSQKISLNYVWNIYSLCFHVHVGPETCLVHHGPEGKVLILA